MSYGYTVPKQARAKAPATTWPEGVIARYLTVGGEALRDPSLSVDVSHDEPGEATAAQCAACATSWWANWSHPTGRHADGTYRKVLRPDTAEADVRRWAQSHAEKCRAMPRPTA